LNSKFGQNVQWDFVEWKNHMTKPNFALKPKVMGVWLCLGFGEVACWILMRLHVEKGVKDICFAWVRGPHLVCGVSLKKIGTKLKKRLARSLKVGYVSGWKRCVFLWFEVIVTRFMRVFALRFGVLCWSSCYFGVVGFVSFCFFSLCACVLFLCTKWSKVVRRFMYFMIWNKVVRFCNIEIWEVV
jgi:hypothetical protein